TENFPCASTNDSTDSTAVSISMPDRCTSASAITTTSCSCTKTFPPRPTTSCEPSLLTAMGSSSAANACSLGTGSPISVLTTTSLSSLVTPCISKPSTAAKPRTTSSMPTSSARCSAAATFPSPTSIPKDSAKPAIFCGAGSFWSASEPTSWLTFKTPTASTTSPSSAKSSSSPATATNSTSPNASKILPCVYPSRPICK